MKALKKVLAAALAAVMMISVFNIAALEAAADDTIDLEVFYGYGKQPGQVNRLSGVFTGGLADQGNGYSIKGSIADPYTNGPSSGTNNRYDHPKQGEISSVDLYYGGSDTPYTINSQVSNDTHCIKGTVYVTSGGVLTSASSGNTKVVTFAAAAKGDANAMASRWFNITGDIDLVIHYNGSHTVTVDAGAGAQFASATIPKYFLTTTDSSAAIEVGGDYESTDKPLILDVTPAQAPKSVIFALDGRTATLSGADVSGTKYLSSEYTFSDTPAEGDILKFDGATLTVYKVTGDINVTCAYTEEKKTVTFMNGSAQFAQHEVVSGTPVGAPDTDPEAPEGYTFGGWCTDPEAETPYDFSAAVDSDLTLYARFEENHTVTFTGAATFTGGQYGVNISSSSWASLTGGTEDKTGVLVTAGDYVSNTSATSSGVQVRVNDDAGTRHSLIFTFGGHSTEVTDNDLVNKAIYLKDDGSLTSAFDSEVTLKYALSNGVVFLRVYKVTCDMDVKVTYEGGSETVGASFDDPTGLFGEFTVSDTDRTAGTVAAADGFTAPYFELKGVEAHSVLASFTAKEPDVTGIRILDAGSEVATFEASEKSVLKEIENVGLIRFDYSGGTYSLRFLYLLRPVTIAPAATVYSEGGAIFMGAQVGESITATFTAQIDAATQAAYDSFVMKVSLGDILSRDIPAEAAGGSLRFDFTGVNAVWMNEKITGAVYGVKDGNETDIGLGITGGISIAEYCDLVAAAHPMDATLLRFMSNMLHFGSECQKYLDADVDESALPETGRAWVTGHISGEAPVAPEGTGSVNTFSAGFDSGKGKIRGVGLNIAQKISLGYRISVPDGVEGVTFAIDGAAVDLTGYTPDENGEIRVLSERLGPSSYNSVLTAVLTTPGGTQTVRYSVDDYCARKAADPALAGIISAIYNYGFAARNEIVQPRIAFVGDSITFGYQVGYNDLTVPEWSYPSRLQEMMGDSVIIGNFGRSGAFITPLDDPNNYWVAQNEKTDRYYPITDQYTQSIAFEPDTVVIMLGTNDFRSMKNAAARDNFKGYLKALADVYQDLPSVDKVYIATSIPAYSSAAAFEMLDGAVQQLQREAAALGGYEVIDIYSMMRDYLNVSMYYASDRLHPDSATYNEIARAFAAFFGGETYVPGDLPVSATGTVYVKDGGTGDGSSPDAALASLEKAVGLLRKTGGRVVICGDYTTEHELILPENEQPITITASDGETNYGATLIMTQNMQINGEVTFEDLAIAANRLSNPPLIFCRFNDVTFGGGLTMTDQAGKGFPGIVVGDYHYIGGCPADAAGFDGACTVNVQSGTWSFLRGGNYRAHGTAIFGSIAAGACVTVNVSGGTFRSNSGNDQFAATGMNCVDGTCTLNITGGVFEGPVYCLSRPGANQGDGVWSMNGTVNVNVSGGTFATAIKGMQEPVTYTGTVNVNIDDLMENKPGVEGLNDRVAEDVFASASFTDTNGTTIPYRYYFPEGYDRNGTAKYPVFFYFHGNGSRGSDNKKQIDVGTHLIVTKVLNYAEDAIIVAAQCPASPEEWVDHACYPGSSAYDPLTTPISTYLSAALELCNYFLANEKIDPARIYIGGASNGAGACWSIIAHSPLTVAAAVILAGTGQTGGAESIAKYYVGTPIRTFHGDADTTLSVEGTRQLVSAIVAAGGSKITYTEMPGYGHNIWTAAANTSGLLDWMFAQRRADSVGVFRLNGQAALTSGDLTAMQDNEQKWGPLH